MRNDILSTYPTPQSEELLYPPQQWVEPETKALTMDELIRSNRDLEQLAFAASHDLQEPLKVISLYLEFFNKKYKGRLDEKADQIIFSILDRSERMQKLVQNMLSYAQVGKENTPFVRIDSAVALTRAIENLKVSIDENSARITYDDCPVIMGDEVQLTQLFQNLINNAIKFRKKGELPYIHVSAKRTEGHWLFSIQDNGIGIDN